MIGIVTNKFIILSSSYQSTHQQMCKNNRQGKSDKLQCFGTNSLPSPVMHNAEGDWDITIPPGPLPEKKN